MASEINKNNNTRLENIEANSNPTVSKPQTNNPQPPKKTRPRSHRDWENTFDPGAHGLLVRGIADRNRKPADAVQELYGSLTQRFDHNRGDVVSLLLIELTTVDYWRMSKGLEYEQKAMADGYAFYKDYMDCMTRYVGAARRNLDKSLQVLMRIEKENEEAAAPEADSETTEALTSVADSSPDSEPNTSTKSDQPSQAAWATSACAPSTEEQPAADAVAAGATASTSNQEEGAPQAQPSTAAPLPPTNDSRAEQTTPAEPATAEVAAETTAGESAGEQPAADLPAAA